MYLLLVLIPCIYFYIMWRRFGRDPRTRGIIAPRYDSPDNLSPAQTGIVLDQRVDSVDIAALIVSIAQKGYMKIKDIQTQSFGPSLRVYFLDEALTPFVGGGVNFIRVVGDGEFQGLDESLIAGWLLGGIDYQLWSNLRISGGVNIHFPVRLIFPFIDAAYYF
jgi:hypothetical protein